MNLELWRHPSGAVLWVSRDALAPNVHRVCGLRGLGWSTSLGDLRRYGWRPDTTRREVIVSNADQAEARVLREFVELMAERRGEFEDLGTRHGALASQALLEADAARTLAASPTQDGGTASQPHRTDAAPAEGSADTPNGRVGMRKMIEDWTADDIETFKRLVEHEIEVTGPKDVLGYARQAAKTLEAVAALGGWYERACELTAIYPGKGEIPGLIYTALGLAGESGEFADKMKKLLRDADGNITEERRDAMIAELGDVLWYVARAASELGTDLDTVASRNVKKLMSRKHRGKLGGSGDDR